MGEYLTDEQLLANLEKPAPVDKISTNEELLKDLDVSSKAIEETADLAKANIQINQDERSLFQRTKDNVIGFVKGLPTCLFKYDFVGNIWKFDGNQLIDRAKRMQRDSYVFKHDFESNPQYQNLSPRRRQEIFNLYYTDRLKASEKIEEKGITKVEVGNKLKADHQKFMNSYISPDEADSFGFKLGSGASSLYQAFTLSRVMPLPGIAGMSLAAEGAADMYNRAVESGLSHTQGKRLSFTNFAVNSVIEEIGFGAIFKGGTNIVTRVMKGMVTESLQEGAQTTFDNWQINQFIDSNHSLTENVFTSMMVGGILGCFGAGIDAKVKTNMRESIKKQYPTEIQNMKNSGFDQKQIDGYLDTMIEKSANSGATNSQLMLKDEFRQIANQMAYDDTIPQKKFDMLTEEDYKNNPTEFAKNQIKQLDNYIAERNNYIVQNEQKPEMRGEVEEAKKNIEYATNSRIELDNQMQLANLSPDERIELDKIKKDYDLEEDTNTIMQVQAEQHPLYLASEIQDSKRLQKEGISPPVAREASIQHAKTNLADQAALQILKAKMPPATGQTLIDQYEIQKDNVVYNQTQGFKIGNKMQGLLNKHGLRGGENYVARKSLGTYYPNTKDLRTVSLNSPSVVIHESAHALDDRFGIIDNNILAPESTKTGVEFSSEIKEIQGQLSDLYVNFYPGAKRNHKMNLKMKEGFASLVDLYVAHPTTIEEAYPNLVKEFLKPGGKYYNNQVGGFIKDSRQIINEYQKLDPLSKVGARMATDLDPVIVKSKILDGKNILTSGWNKFEYQFNQMLPLQKVGEQAGVARTEADPYAKAYQYQKIGGLVQHNLFGTSKSYFLGRVKTPEGFRNLQYQTILPYNWNTLRSEMDNDGVAYNQFSEFLVARRAYSDFKYLKGLAREVADMKANPNVDEKILKAKVKEYNEFNKVVKNDGFDEAVVTQAYLENKDKFRKYTDMYDGLNRASLSLLRNSGYIDNNTYQKLSSREGYAPLKRSFYDSIEGELQAYQKQIKGAVGVKKVSSLMGRTGSMKTINDPIQSAMMNSMEMTRKAALQMVNNSIVNLAGKVDPTVIRVLDPKTKYEPTDPTIVEGIREGAKVAVKIDDPLILQSLQDVLTPESLPVWMEIMQKGNRIFTKGTVGLYPLFSITNFSRDQATAWLNTRNRLVPFYSLMKELGVAFSNTQSVEAQYAKEFCMMNPETQTIYGIGDMTLKDIKARLEGESKTIKEIGKNIREKGTLPDNMTDVIEGTAQEASKKVKKGLGWINDKLGWLPEHSEMATRMTEYILARKSGKSSNEAMLDAADVTGAFYRRGRKKSLGSLTQMIPFANATIQIFNQFAIKTASPQGLKRLALVTGAYTAVQVAGMLLSLGTADEEEIEQLTNLRPDELSNFLFLKNPFGKGFFKATVSPQTSWLAGVINMALIDKLTETGYNRREYLETTSSLLPDQFNITDIKRMGVSWIPQMIKVPIELFSNYNFFFGAPIETAAEKTVEPKYRYDIRRTSPLARFVGDKFNMSPKLIDHALKGSLTRSSALITGQPGQYIGQEKIMRTFYKPVDLMTGRKIQRFYELRDEYAQKAKTVKSEEKERRQTYSKKERTEIMETDGRLKAINLLTQTYNKQKRRYEKKHPKKHYFETQTGKELGFTISQLIDEVL